MNRRAFLASLTATIGVAALPIPAAALPPSEWEPGGVLVDFRRDFYVSREGVVGTARQAIEQGVLAFTRTAGWHLEPGVGLHLDRGVGVYEAAA